MVQKSTPQSWLFVVSMLGFFVSVVYLIKFSETWAVAFALLFLILFISSLKTLADDVEDPIRKTRMRALPVKKVARKAARSVSAKKKKGARKKSVKRSMTKTKAVRRVKRKK